MGEGALRSAFGSTGFAWVAGRSVRTRAMLVSAVLVCAVVAGCARLEMPAHLKPLSRDAMMLLGSKKMTAEAPIFVRIFKAESELEVWKQRPDGRFYHFKTYPICTWSGDLGPKFRQGDKQAPEGFYSINRHLMNPNSSFHLAFNLGYPNAFDRAHNRTGDFLMVHGECTSAGCYAMTNPLIEEIYALAREAFIGGQTAFEVHAFPFRMTDENMEMHREHRHYEFWTTLKPAYDLFELNRVPPPITICEKRYVVNAVPANGAKADPAGRCPRLETAEVEPFLAAAGEDEERIVVPGVKRRQVHLPVSDTLTAAITGQTAPQPAAGLTRVPSGGPFSWRQRPSSGPSLRTPTEIFSGMQR
ncbi:MAG: hypothetical protein ACFCUN_11740 [Hyphomicrobiaceae bacterium]